MLVFAHLLLALTRGAVAAEASGAPILRVETGRHTALTQSLAVDAAGKRVFSASDDKTIRVWQLPDWRLSATYRIPIGPGHEGQIYSIALSPDGQTLAVGGWTGWSWESKGSVYILDAATGELLKRIGGFDEVIGCVRFSPDGRHIAVGLMGDTGLRVLRGSDYREVARDTQHGDKILFVDFDIPVTPARERLLRREEGSAFSRVVLLDLAGIHNDIRIEVFNGKSIGFAEKYVSAPRAAEVKPGVGNLYVLAVGVNAFTNLPREVWLSFAAQDADEIAAQFRKAGGGYYRSVHAKVISDSALGKPEKANILQALEFIKPAQAEDTVVVFLASHGISDAAGNYYFVPRDAVLQDIDALRIAGGGRSSLLSWTVFFDAIRITAGKRLLIVDTCQAKNIAGTFDAHALVKRSASSQFSFLLASKAGEDSQEYPEGGHGLFTYALLNALAGGLGLGRERPDLDQGSLRLHRAAGRETVTPAVPANAAAHYPTSTRGLAFGQGCRHRSLSKLQFKMSSLRVNSIHWSALLLGLAMVMCTAQAQAWGDERIALVIGNSSYAAAALRNPVDDARDVAAALRSLGFTVIHRENASLGQMLEAMREFLTIGRNSQVRLFYFAGHGVQLKGQNYLVPVDVVLKEQYEVPSRAASVPELVGKLGEMRSGVNIVILDACRNAPFPILARTRSMEATRGIAPGLAMVSAPRGTVVAFSTAPGSVALDGKDRNSAYTKHLLANIDIAGLPIEQLFKRVRIGVSEETREAQIPGESSSLMGEFCFRPAPTGDCAIGPNENLVSGSLTSR